MNNIVSDPGYTSMEDFVAQNEDCGFIDNRAEHKIDILVDALRTVLTWAEQRCPCHDETPDPCPLCGASVEKGVCLSAENTIPRDILRKLRLALILV